MIAVQKLCPEEWSSMSLNAHIIAFNEKRDPFSDRISFALIAGEGKIPLGFITCLELNSESVYIQHGGAMPSCIGTAKSYETWLAMLEWLDNSNYKNLTMLVKNTNTKMIKFVYDKFLITGVSVFNNETFIEFSRNR